jgi:hypothetical protein
MSNPGIDVVGNLINNLPNIFFLEGVYLWNREGQLTSKIRKEFGRGPNVNWTVSNGGAKTFYRGAGYAVNPATDAYQDDRVQMQLQRGILSTTWGFTDSELAQLRSYVTTDAAADIIKMRLQDAYLEALSTHVRTIELQLLTGTGSGLDPQGNSQNAIVGFLSALATSGTYAGQTFNNTTNPGLVSNIITPSGGNVTRAYVRQMFAKIEQATGSNPTFIMASPLTVTYLQGIADNQIRYFGAGASQEILSTTNPNQTMTPSACTIFGVPVYANSAWGASTASSLAANADGYIIFGQERYIKLDCLNYGPAPDALMSEVRSGLSSNGQGFDQVGVPVRCWAQAKTAASLVINMDSELAFTITKPNAFGVMNGVTGFTPNT